MSILHSSVVHLIDLVSLREALLDARRDTVMHCATDLVRYYNYARSGFSRESALKSKAVGKRSQLPVRALLAPDLPLLGHKPKPKTS